MISNLQFYGVAAAIGFIISLAFRKEDEIPSWNVWTVVLFPICWAILGVTMIMTLGDGRIETITEILAYFDAERLFDSEGFRKGQILVLLIFPIYFTLTFSLLWRIKNKHIQSSHTTPASAPR